LYTSETVAYKSEEEVDKHNKHEVQNEEWWILMLQIDLS
jgi:hypothetical protein